MPTVPLTGGAYEARSVIASAQCCINLVPEPMPQGQGEPAPAAHNLTGGLRLVTTLPQNVIRGIRQVTTGFCFVVAGNGVYQVDTNTWATVFVGSITSGRTTPVSMADNGTTLVIVDGTANGWTVDIATNSFATIVDSTGMFSGADRVDYLDTFFLFNKPGTPQFYSSLSNSVSFDSLYFANKESFSDELISLAVVKREIWLIGNRTTEIWANMGTPDFPFGEVPGVFVDHGTIAKYSIATYDNSVLWLSLDRAGKGIVMHGADYQTRRMSTYAIEAEFATYSTLTDAIAYTYQLGGHAFYVITFPSADKTWSLDLGTGLWHQWAWMDTSSVLHRHRSNCGYAVDGLVLVGDWQNGNLYVVDQQAYDDNGAPIRRQRAFPHLLNEGKRVFYREFIADLETGTGTTGVGGPASDFLESTFAAPDNTLLEAYSSPTDIGTWSAQTTGMQIVSHQVVSTGVGNPVYEASVVAPEADYILQFRVSPTDYTTVTYDDVWIVGRSLGTDATGYEADIFGDGTQWWVDLLVLPSGTFVQLALGTIAAGAYICTLSMIGSAITVGVQRTIDGLYVGPGGLWSSSPTPPCISITDTTYTAAGVVLMGAEYAT